jgi:hypothetical protein
MEEVLKRIGRRAEELGEQEGHRWIVSLIYLVLSGSQAILDWRQISNALTETLRNSAFWTFDALGTFDRPPMPCTRNLHCRGTLFCNPNFRVVTRKQSWRVPGPLAIRPHLIRKIVSEPMPREPEPVRLPVVASFPSS